MLRAKDNPFAVDRIRQIRYEPPEESWKSLLERLAVMKYRGAIVGPCGSGKTTLCEDLQIRLRLEGMQTQQLFVSMDIHMTWQDIQCVLALPFDVILVDGADHMSWLTWQRLKHYVLSKKRGLVVTTHRPGLLPTWYECLTSLALFERIVDHLNPDQSIHPEHIRESYDRWQGNIRDALRELYDLVSIEGCLTKSHSGITKGVVCPRPRSERVAGKTAANRN